MNSVQEELLAKLRQLYDSHGAVALSTPFLEKEGSYARLLKAGLYQKDYLRELGLSEQYAEWREETRSYAGKLRPRWTWEEVLEKARQAVEQHGELPTMDWFRSRGQTSLVNTVFRCGKSWGELREALGSFEKSTFRTSRNGMRWLSQPERSMSDFLYARGIEHRHGERYGQGYAEQSGRRHGQYDLHLITPDGRTIDIEIWGDLPDHLSGGKYAKTRALKETWNKTNPNFLGVQFRDCLSDNKLTQILEPYIGVIEPFVFDKPHDIDIETSHWSNSDELLKTCRQLARQMPDGIFPNEQWLRKRGKFADRAGPAYNSVALRINQWLGGMRNLRKLLGQSAESTRKWTPESAVEAWKAFELEHGVTPTQLFVKARAKQFPDDVVKLAQNIRRAARDFKVLDKARDGKTARKIVWTEETVLLAWRDFELKYGLPPSKYVGSKRSAKVTRELRNEAARLYQAARKSGMLTVLRQSVNYQSADNSDVPAA